MGTMLFIVLAQEFPALIEENSLARRRNSFVANSFEEDDRSGVCDRPAAVTAQPRRASMVKETVHLVQAFVAGRGKALKAEPAFACRTAEDARRKAERLSPLRLGVVAFSSSADPELGDYDETPLILFKSGQLPPPFDE